MTSANEISKALVDVRKSFRLLMDFQDIMLKTIYYIQDCSKYKGEEIRGAGNWYFYNLAYGKRSREDKDNSFFHDIRLSRKTVAGSFFPAWFFDYELGNTRISNRNTCFAIIQIADDGVFNTKKVIYEQNAPELSNTENFIDAENANSLLLFAFDVYRGNSPKFWLSQNGQQSTTESYDPCYELFYHILGKNLQKSALRGSKRFIYNNEEEHEINIVQPYSIERFTSKEDIDEVIRDFANLVKKEAKLEIFNAEFYSTKLPQ